MIKLMLSFLQPNLNCRVFASFISERNKSANLQLGQKIESPFMQNSIEKFSCYLVKLREGYYRLRLQFLDTLSFFDRLRFEKYLSLS